MAEFNSPIFEDLEKSFQSRINLSKQERTKDLTEAEVKSQQKLPEGSLGRVETQLDPEFKDAAKARQKFAEGVSLGEPLDLQRENIKQTDASYQNLIDQRRFDSPESVAARENAIINLQRSTQGRLRQARGEAGAGGYVSGAAQAAQQQEALRNESLARGSMERDILLANQEARERLVKDQQNARAANIGQLGNLQISETNLRDNAMARNEAVAESMQDARLERNLYNLESLRSEMFGRLALEESQVQLGVAERAGLRQELVAERGQAESERHARETERIQAIEAEKDPPSGGGGKSIMCVAMWELGYISTEVLLADFEYCRKNIDEDTRRGYFFISTRLAERCIKTGRDGILTKIFKPAVVGWANEMAYRMGVNSKGNLWGKAVCALGVPMCRAIGKILTFFGKEEMCNSRAVSILTKVAHLDPDVIALLPKREKKTLIQNIKLTLGV